MWDMPTPPWYDVHWPAFVLVVVLAAGGLMLLGLAHL